MPRTTLPAAGTDALHMQLELSLYRLVTKFPAGWPVDPVSVQIRVNGTVWTLRAGSPASEPTPSPLAESPLTNRHKKVIEAVRVEVDRLERRVLGREILDALHLVGYRIGRSTLNETLSDLVYRKRLINPKDKLGYGFPGEHEECPLFPESRDLSDSCDTRPD